MERRRQITAIVLCGGRGQRVGGLDKPLLTLHGRPLVGWITEVLSPCAARVLISANRNHAAYRRYGEVVGDTAPGFPGPLAGVVSCLERVATPVAFVCPGDAPWLTAHVVERVSAAVFAGAAAAVAHDGERRQNLHFALKATERAALDRYLAAGHRSVHGWLDAAGAEEVDLSGSPEAFRDVDAPQDLD